MHMTSLVIQLAKRLLMYTHCRNTLVGGRSRRMTWNRNTEAGRTRRYRNLVSMSSKETSEVRLDQA
jgi:hypothetical protein